MTNSIEIQSPRLQRLRSALDGNLNGVETLAAFWREVASQGTPLIEPEELDPTICLVTFLWREVEPVNHVALIEWFSEGDFLDKQMEKLPDTDIWYRSYRIRSDIRTDYQFGPNDPLTPKREEKHWPARRAAWRRDPLNPDWHSDPPEESDGSTHEWSILTLPDAEPQPWIGERAGVPKGSVSHQRFTSSLLGNERDIWLYQPANSAPEVLLVLFDAHRCLNAMNVPALLDNLHAEGAIRPVAAVMIGNVDRGSELPCNPDFLAFLVDELLPHITSGDNFNFAPDEIIAVGQSYGGLAAGYCALERPDIFTAALSQSGSFWWKPDPRNEVAEMVMGDAPAYATLPIRAAELPLSNARFYLDGGRFENRHFSDGAPSLLASNRHMRDVLIAKGYSVTYREFAGGHDAVWWRSTIADGLLALIGTPPKES